MADTFQREQCANLFLIHKRAFALAKLFIVFQKLISFLQKLLSRVTTPTTGSIKVGGRMAALLEVGTGFHPELTGMENIFLNGAILGMTKAEIKSKLDEIIDFSGCAQYIDTPVKRYSSGMRVRLGFAVAAFLEPEITVSGLFFSKC